MTITCKNCGFHYKGNFCSNCGQSAETHEMNFHFLWHDIQHGLLHVDKGLFYTIKELLTRPGNSIREFIEGKRAKHFRPFSLVLILAGIYGIIYHYFHMNMFENKIVVSGTGKEIDDLRDTVQKVIEWLAEHYEIVALAQLPVYATGTYLAFRKSGYNYVEHLVINAFLTGQRLIVQIVFFPLFYFFRDTKWLGNIEGTTTFIGIILMVWSLIQFFDKQKKWKTFWQTLLSYLIFIGIYIILAGIAMLIIKLVY
ncbi:MAG TPA: DUF3667 domain-containing protein [Bacteroidia bacterium]|jgi:hypothetical protein|nr:DUF3667 domain-containing protein [Bacteroidia bacterium]